MKTVEIEENKIEKDNIKKGRVRHSYPLNEIFHRFIHSDEYIYCNNSIKYSAKNDILVVGDIGKNTRDEDIIDKWFVNSERCVAIINRENKKIIVNKKYNKHFYLLIDAVPNDFKIFYTKNNIPCYDILSEHNIETLLKVYSIYLIQEVIENRLKPFYNILYDNSKLLYCNLEYLYEENKDIIQFIDKYKIKKYKWYNEELINDNKLIVKYGTYNYKSVKISTPTLKQIYTKNIFNKKELLEIEQCNFYTIYCYRRGIPFKDVKLYWNKIVSSKEFCNYCNKHNLYAQEDYFIDNTNWRDNIKKQKEISYNHDKILIEKYLKISNENKEKAIKELELDYNNILDNWRKGKTLIFRKISYKRFIPNINKKEVGYWKTITITINEIDIFSNIQLRLAKNVIETSKDAKVPLNDAIKIFKLITHYIKNSKERLIPFHYIKVGIYNLNYITYTDKLTDKQEKLGYKEWLIQIGCHSLWLDDVLNFIHYYKLEKDFGLEEQKKTNN